MISRDHGRRSRRRYPIDGLTAEELAWANEQARRWRAALRKGELLDPPPPTPVAPRRARVPEEARRRAQFAEAIARAEFGRFYRSDRGETERRAKGRRKPDVARPKPP